jgi:hypothetical protein
MNRGYRKLRIRFLEHTAHMESTLTTFAVNRWMRTRGVHLLLGSCFVLISYLLLVEVESYNLNRSIEFILATVVALIIWVTLDPVIAVATLSYRYGIASMDGSNYSSNGTTT